MLTALVVFIGSFVCLLMVIFSLSVGFTFFLVPILLAELMLLAAVYLMREAFGSSKEKKQDREPPLAWYAKRDQAPPPALERLDERYSRPYRTESPRPYRSEERRPYGSESPQPYRTEGPRPYRRERPRPRRVE